MLKTDVFSRPFCAQASGEVEVPRVLFGACQELEKQLDLINPLLSGDYFSTDIYLLFVNTVGYHLRSGCTRCS